MKKYKLGERFTITEIVEGKGMWRRKKLRKPIEGIVTGKRTVQLGFTTYCDDEGYLFTRLGSVNVYEVTYDINRKPFKIEIDRKLDEFSIRFENNARSNFEG